MQEIFEVDVSPSEYARQGINFEFPVPKSCPNPECLIPISPKKHGFYERNSLGFCYCGKIIIRRYYCPYCGKTISYLPSFCLPYFQYSLAIIYQILSEYLVALNSYSRIIKKFKRKHNKLSLESQHMSKQGDVLFVWFPLRRVYNVYTQPCYTGYLAQGDSFTLPYFSQYLVSLRFPPTSTNTGCLVC